MQSEKLLGKFYNNYLENFRKKQVKIVPASFDEWIKFDLKYKSGVFATICPFCSSEKVESGFQLDTKKTGLRDFRYIEYECEICGGHFLV